MLSCKGGERREKVRGAGKKIQMNIKKMKARVSQAVTGVCCLIFQ